MIPQRMWVNQHNMLRSQATKTWSFTHQDWDLRTRKIVFSQSQDIRGSAPRWILKVHRGESGTIGVSACIYPPVNTQKTRPLLFMGKFTISMVIFHSCVTVYQKVRVWDIFWLVVYLPLWKIWKSVGIIIPITGKVMIPRSCNDQTIRTESGCDWIYIASKWARRALQHTCFQTAVQYLWGYRHYANLGQIATIRELKATPP